MSCCRSKVEDIPPEGQSMSRNRSRVEDPPPERKAMSRNSNKSKSPPSENETMSRNRNRVGGPSSENKTVSRNRSRAEGPPPETVRFKDDNPKCEQDGCEITKDDILYQNIEKRKIPDNKPNPNAKFQHFPKFSKYHPLIPRRYVQGWKNDMKNRKQLISHAVESYIYPGPHDESLYLQRRERLNHGEARCCVERKIEPPDRFYLLHPLFYHHLSRYQSGLMYRHETRIARCSCQKQ